MEEEKKANSNTNNNDEIKNKKQEEVENNKEKNSDLGQSKNNSNFFNKSLNAVNLANNSLNGLNNMTNNMGNNEDLSDKMSDPNETRNALNQMGNRAAQNINNATNLARGINNKIQNKKNKNKEDEKDDNNKDDKKDDKDNKNKDDKKDKNKESNNKKSSIDNKETKKRKLLKGKNKNSKAKTKEGLKKNIVSFFMKLPLSLKLGIIAFGVILIFIILFLIIFAIFAGSASNGDNCSSEATEKDLKTFINTFEGGEYCDKEKTKYKVYQNSGDRVTVGPGITTDYIKDMKVGDCISVEEVDEAQTKAIATKRESVKKYFKSVNLTNYQEDALVSMLYNGCANMFSDMATAYKEDSYEGLWNVMKNCTNKGMLGLQRRRRAEYALFVTGDYTIAPDYKTKTFTDEEYDDYNYDDVMSRKDSVKTTCTSFNSSWINPSIRFCGVSSCYGPRIHPVTGSASFHEGVDLACDMGEDIIASAAGEVIDISTAYTSNQSYGAYVLIKHNDEYQTMYGHMSKVIVEVGDQVEQGQKIGEVGTSGISTGPHIHFEVRKSNTADDPAKYVDLRGECD